MKKIARISIGSLILGTGAGLIALSCYEVFLVQEALLWLLFIPPGLVLVGGGYEIMRGYSIGDVLKSIFSPSLWP